MGMRLQAGTTLSHYQILAPLGAGGMGEVYRARDARLDRDVAIKVLPDILASGELADYHLAHAARADLCRRLGRTVEARESYERAWALAKQEPERRFLQKRLQELG